MQDQTKDSIAEAVGVTLALLFLTTWVAGIVLAKGFFGTSLAIFFFPYGWYVVGEAILRAWGWV